MAFFDVLPSDELVAVTLWERPPTNAYAFFQSWTYPCVPPHTTGASSAASSPSPLSPATRPPLLSTVIQAHLTATMGGAGGMSHTFSSYQSYWFCAAAVPSSTAVVTVVSKYPYPAQYTRLATALAAVYAATGSTVALLKAWLTAFRTASLSLPSLPAASWVKDEAAAVTEASGCRDMVRALALQSILPWTALLLRKRVAVFGMDAPSTMRAVMALGQLGGAALSPAVTAARATAGSSAPPSAAAPRLIPILTPCTATLPAGAPALDAVSAANLAAGVEAQLADLLPLTPAALESATSPPAAAGSSGASGSASVAAPLVVGFTDEAMLTHQPPLWDVCVDISSNTVVVAEHAQASFVMSPVHKQIAKAMLAAAEAAGASDASVAATLRERTDALLAAVCEAVIAAGVPRAQPTPQNCATLAQYLQTRASELPDSVQTLYTALYAAHQL